MNKVRYAAILALAMVLVFTCAMPADRPVDAAARDGGDAVYLVLAKQGNYSQALARVATAGGQVTYAMPELEALIATSADLQFAKRLASDPAVEGVAEDQGVVALSETLYPSDDSADGPTGPSQPTAKDSLYRQQWDIQRIGGAMDRAWAVTTGKHTVRVAVLDTGIYAKHPDIAPNIDVSLSRSFLTNNPPQDPRDLSARDLAGHGTFVAGQIAGAFGGGKIVGIGPGLSVVNVKMINKNGRLWFSWALPAIYYAATSHFEVANMSWSGSIDTSTASGNLL